jgi:hypothetical protein
MIALERELAQDWQNLFYPPGPEMPDEPQAPVEGAGGAAFGVFPAMRSAASRTGEISPAGRMLPADVAAGALKGTVTGGVGLPGDIESLVRGIRGIFTRGGDQGKLDAFLAGVEEKTILPTSEDVSKWLDANVGPVVPPGAPMAEQRAGVAEVGQFAGEMVSGPGTLVKGAKAGAAGAAATAKFVKPKVGEMLSDYMSRSGLTPELMAFHGTPHRFAAEEGAPLGRFRSEKIGSGEGAQAYGYGTYFAEAPGVAKGYQTALSGYSADGKRLPSDIGMIVSNYGGDVTAAIADKQRQIDKWSTRQDRLGEKVAVNIVKGLQDDISKLSALQGKRLESTGSLYTVDIPDEMIGKMLDWDKPLSQQPKAVQEFADKILNDPRRKQAGFTGGKTNAFGEEMTGADFYNTLKATWLFGGEKGGVEAARQAGIPGVRYLDAGSRGAGDGTRNIVVFPGEEDKVKILKVE